jgi:phosphoribosyl 1,2-cyclic phosphate phosphodiesterase
MKVTVLGSGTSQGVPIVGCGCSTCKSKNPKDKRLRVSVYLEQNPGEEKNNNLKLLFDTSPDFRQQMLVNNITDIDAVIYTHHHIDHIMGLDDIRQINQLRRKSVDLYGNQTTINYIKQTFSFIFDENTYKGGGIPDVKTNIITTEKFFIGNVEVIPLEYFHGPIVVYGYRVGDFAYMTDCSFIPETEFPKLRNLKVLILDALRYRPHATHFNFEQAIEAAQKIGAAQTYFTHMTHDILHDTDNAKLPKGIEIAYDQLSFEI